MNKAGFLFFASFLSMGCGEMPGGVPDAGRVENDADTASCDPSGTYAVSWTAAASNPAACETSVGSSLQLSPAFDSDGVELQGGSRLDCPASCSASCTLTTVNSAQCSAGIVTTADCLERGGPLSTSIQFTDTGLTIAISVTDGAGNTCEYTATGTKN